MTTNYDFNNFRKDKITPIRSLGWSNWAKFEKVGDVAQGYIRDVFYKKAEGMYPEGRGITLEQKDGTFMNVSIKTHDFVLRETDDLRLGDPLTIELTELKKSSTKGFNPTKVLTFYGAKLPENDGQPTVKALYEADMRAGGSSNPEPVSEDKKEDIMPEAPAVDPNSVPFP
ncbi:MAG: hypothetical protein ACP5N7_05915 [Candidatus Pacearchaeota archaeon]